MSSFDIKKSVLPIPGLDTVIAPELGSEDVEQQIAVRDKFMRPIAVRPRVYVTETRLTDERRTKNDGICTLGNGLDKSVGGV